MSALIFAAVAAAWAVYLVPKALRHHEESAASRGIDEISGRARVLARRDAVSSRATALIAGRKVAGSGAEDSTPSTSSSHSSSAPRASAASPREEKKATASVEAVPARPHAKAAQRAAQRRRRVLVSLLSTALIVAALATAGRIGWLWLAIPVALVVAWLVACRLMVRTERARRAAPVRKRRTTLADVEIAAEDEEAEAADESTQPPAGQIDANDDTDEIPAVAVKPGTWAPVNVPLPTYVDKAPAQRTVRTIDLDSTGVWTSGRREIDSEIAREAEAKDRAARATRDAAGDISKRRASGS